jgi:hypothetical protein
MILLKQKFDGRIFPLVKKILRFQLEVCVEKYLKQNDIKKQILLQNNLEYLKIQLFFISIKILKEKLH